MEPELISNMTKVKVLDDLDHINLETLRPRFIQSLSIVDFKQHLMNALKEKDGITIGIYVEMKNNKVEQWTIVTTEKKKRRKTTTPKIWYKIGLHCGEYTILCGPQRDKFPPEF